MADCSVYSIGFDLTKGPSKVGIASDPLKRMATLQTAHFQKLVCAGWWATPDREIARQLEIAFHATQAKFRLSGEWFDIPPNKCMAILMIGLGVMLNLRCGMDPDQVNEALATSRVIHG